MVGIDVGSGTNRATARQSPSGRGWLLAAVAVVSILAWQTETGRLALYPFTILATWFHEMGHGLAGMLTGRTFERLVIFPNGSGYALTVRFGGEWRLASAFVSAAGPLGPAVAGSLLILASRRIGATRACLAWLGLALLISTLIWVRSPIGWVVLPAMGVGLVLLATYGSATWQRLGVQVVGVQAGISAWQQFGYLFSSSADIGGRLSRSDTGAIAEALFLPYWVWGAAVSALIVTLLTLSARHALRP
ncbi:M50 family metallopeptidase [Parvularcula dongshanensis]|uniref:M50 family peptidase n=1 Tax=Parvularcula dongshanensis TaxID=1173995 RepID=A0A840I5Q5_9PROT|nr:M50 family metallopeptidase [Parvularcula dongshanensis]MBB4660199.1 hypothetical protein [Parvularcula dongshanensis]